MSHGFGTEYDELIARARLGAAYDDHRSEIVAEREPILRRKKGKKNVLIDEKQGTNAAVAVPGCSRH